MSKFIAVAAVAAIASATLQAPTPTYKVLKANKIEVAPVPVCSENTPYDPELGCATVKTAKPTIRCPTGYKKVNGVCTVTTYGKSTTTCQKGSYLDGNKCVTEINSAPEVTCTKGELIDDEVCLVVGEPKVVETKTAAFNLSCEKGYKLVDDACVKDVSTSATLVCDDANAKLVGASCVNYEFTNKTCQLGYTREGTSCVATSTTPVSMDCPKGTMEDKDGNCVVKVTASAQHICEKGYELKKAGLCEARVLITGTLMNAPSKPTPMDVDCRLGSIDADGNCYQTITATSATTCDVGFTFDGTTCVSYVPADRAPTCADGWKMVDFSCVKVDTAVPTCPSGYVVSTSTVDKGYETGECVRASASTSSYVCPTGFNLAGSKTKKVSTSCTAVETVPATATCPKGFEAAEGSCIVPGHVVPAEDQSIPAKVSCPKGYTLNAEQGCVDTITSEPIVFCDKGFELVGKRCQAIFTADAQVVCPKNFVASADGKTCTKTIYRRPTFVCPEGSDSVGKNCYTYEAAEIITVPSTEGFKKGN